MTLVSAQVGGRHLIACPPPPTLVNIPNGGWVGQTWIPRWCLVGEIEIHVVDWFGQTGGVGTWDMVGEQVGVSQWDIVGHCPVVNTWRTQAQPWVNLISQACLVWTPWHWVGRWWVAACLQQPSRQFEHCWSNLTLNCNYKLLLLKQLIPIKLMTNHYYWWCDDKLVSDGNFLVFFHWPLLFLIIMMMTVEMMMTLTFIIMVNNAISKYWYWHWWWHWNFLNNY